MNKRLESIQEKFKEINHIRGNNIEKETRLPQTAKYRPSGRWTGDDKDGKNTTGFTSITHNREVRGKLIN